MQGIYSAYLCVILHLFDYQCGIYRKKKGSNTVSVFLNTQTLMILQVLRQTCESEGGPGGPVLDQYSFPRLALECGGRVAGGVIFSLTSCVRCST